MNDKHTLEHSNLFLAQLGEFAGMVFSRSEKERAKSELAPRAPLGRTCLAALSKAGKRRRK